jgi:hypothetical protein
MNLLLIFSTSLLALMPNRTSAATLPDPSGHNGIGRQRFEWTDSTRHNPDGSDRRLLVFILYPAATTREVSGEYFPGAGKAEA